MPTPSPDADRALVQALVARQPLPQPRCVPLWHAAVDIGEREPLGRSPLGERWIVPILGGHFWGAPGHEALRGVVPPSLDTFFFSNKNTNIGMRSWCIWIFGMNN